MNHTSIASETPHMTPRRRMGVWVLSHTQLGLLLGCAGIGLILAFGGGFIVGMWYQGSEHLSPYPEPVSSMADAPPQTESQDLIFYSTLTKSDNPSVPAVPTGVGKATQRPASSQGGGALVASVPKAGERAAEPAGGSQSPVTKPAALPKAPDRPVEVAGNGYGATAKAPVAVKGSERQTAPAQTSQHTAANIPSSVAGYSVQVGSFRSRDQAESLRQRLTHKGYRVAVQPTTIPGKGVWYRVQAGGFPERRAADRLAQQLATQERMAGVVIDGSR